MPYAPVLDGRAGEYIMRGAEIASQAMSKGISDMKKSAQEEDYLRGLAPYYFGDKPELQKKFVESNLAGKRGMITAAQADEAHQQRTMENQFRLSDINARYYGIDTQAKTAREGLQYDADKFKIGMEAGVPREMTLGDEVVYYTPRTGNVMRQRKPLPAPGGQTEIPVYDGPNNTGNVVAKRMWDPIKGAYDTVDVRARSSGMDGLTQLLTGGGGGGSTAPAQPQQRPPSIPATPPQVKTKADRDALPAGTQYIGPDGKTYIKK